MALWGVLSACTAAVHNPSGLMASRFFLGFVEAVFFPGALFYMSLFYTKKQFAMRTAILYSGSQIGNAFGGLFAVAILKLDGKHGLEGWRWVSCFLALEPSMTALLNTSLQLFLIEGVATVGLAIILAFILPNSLKSITGLSGPEHEYLLWSFEEDHGQQDNADEASVQKGVMMAVTDPKTWFFMGTLYCVCDAIANSHRGRKLTKLDLYCRGCDQLLPFGGGHPWILTKQNLRLDRGQ
jgi:MFS family permease